MQKLNLLNHYSPKYFEQMQVIPPMTLKNYRTQIPSDVLIKHFHTLSMAIDCQNPNISLEQQRMRRVTNMRLN
jgi:hypothetical protein